MYFVVGLVVLVFDFLDRWRISDIDYWISKVCNSLCFLKVFGEKFGFLVVMVNLIVMVYFC